MTLPRLTAVSLSCFVLGCSSPLATQGLPGSSSPPTLSSPTSQATNAPSPSVQSGGGERAQFVWDKMMEGVAMGGAIGGPYGAGGGLIIGLIAGLFTADSHFQQINARVQAEQAKDRELEAQIEHELGNQRELEAQLGTANGSVSATRPSDSTGTGSPEKAPENTQKHPPADPPVAITSLEPRNSPTPAGGAAFRNVEVRDVNKDGVPDLWIYYNPARPGEIIRQEEDTNGDGRVDTWSIFKDGKLLRREVDTKGSGTPDIFYIYEKDMIAREERDEYGDGRRSYRAFYQNGRLAKVEKDTDGDGKIDLWISYDMARDGNVVLREEADLNGDGAIDLWTFYEAGKLVRRDVSATGIEILSKQGKGFSLPAESSENRVVKNDSGAVR